MTSLQGIFMLISLSSSSLLSIILLLIIDLLQINTRQKIIFIKISLLILISIPFINYVIQHITLQELFITLPNQLIDLKSEQISKHITFDQQNSWSFYIMIFYGIGFVVMIKLAKKLMLISGIWQSSFGDDSYSI